VFVDMALFSVPLLAHEWVKVGVTANELKQRIGQFAHPPPVGVRSGADGAFAGAVDRHADTRSANGLGVCLLRDPLARGC
jgi:hypothetical protein